MFRIVYGAIQGGPLTWIYPADEERKACLDLVIVSNNLLPFVSELFVDIERKFTPKRVVVTKKGGLVMRYTDHPSLIISLSGLPTTKEKTPRKTCWNLDRHRKDGKTIGIFIEVDSMEKHSEFQSTSRILKNN